MFCSGTGTVILLTLHVDELLGQLVVGGIVLVVELRVRRVVHLWRGNDQSGAYCSLQMMLLLVISTRSRVGEAAKKENRQNTVLALRLTPCVHTLVFVFSCGLAGDGRISEVV